ncbi:MAG: NAD-dependent epimerase/dehydratase family protein [Dehalococcoidia bacterium]
MATGRVRVVEGDIRDANLIDVLTAGADLVFHQAALRITTPGNQCALEVMVGEAQNVLEAAVRHGVGKVLAASSASVYGEPSYLPMDEAHPFNNRTLYGAAKIANEQMLRAYADMYGLRYVALRPFNVYGPRMDVFGAYTEVMIRWLERLQRAEPPIIFGDGMQTMDFVHVRDVARAYLLAAVAPVTDDVFNVGSGTETSLRGLCRALCEAADRPEMEPLFEPPRKVNPVTRRQAATERARAALGFESRVGLYDGLSELVRWHAGVARGEGGVV